MTSITTDSSHGRFSRPGFTFGLKSRSKSHERARGSQRDRDDDWCIPYTGPYEPPPEPRSSRTRVRDSWGDPIYAGEAVGDGAPRVHYDDSPSDRGYSSRASEESRVRGRERACSVSSSYTTSARPTDVSQRRNFTTYHPTQPALSYITPEVGGVGECPVPHLRQSKDRPSSPRASLASIFTFGVGPPSSPVRADRAAKSPTRKLPFRPHAVSADGTVSRVSTREHRRTISGGSTSQSTGSRHAAGDLMQSLSSQTTTDEDYYNSYYSTLVNIPTKVHGTDSINAPRNSQLFQSTSASPHPYIVVSQAADQSQSSSTNPQSAPPSSGSYDIQPIIPKLAFSETPSNHLNTADTPPNSSSNETPRKLIKGSVSTPNLQAVNTNARLGVPRRIPKSIERWLSAETWCDALLFPRPRLKLRNESGFGRRTVSPPEGAVVPTGSGAARATESVPSRVLAHSRSLVNLRGPQEGQKPASPPNLPPTRSHTSAENVEQAATSNRLRPPRPRSWSSDDLDLPTPVPSLARVLAEGERLDSERKEWQSRASHSLGNKQARNVSRSRSKSLTANGRKADTQARGNLNYLAARAVHGNQDVIPLVPSMRKQGKLPSQRGSTPRSSQSQTNTSSLGRSQTHSSKSHSRDHSRNDSWSKSALKMVQSAPCCDTDATKTPIIENAVPQQKGASKTPRNNDGSARDVDSAFVVIGPSTTLSVPAIRPSPSPSNASGITDPRVGIAISTPLTDELLNRDSLRLPSHPYAQGGLYSSPGHPFYEQPAEYAGRHPVTSATRSAELSDGPAARHKYQPHAQPSHPYAQVSPSLDSYDDNLVNYVLADSSAPPAPKARTPLGSGAVREVLPGEMKCSPFIDEDGNVTGITDTAGVGEVLAYAAEQQKEGESSAEESGLDSAARMQSVRKEVDESRGRLGSRSRVPVQYDVTRQVPPQYLQKAPDTPHTFASSPLEHRFTPKIPQFVKDEMQKDLTVPAAGSAESSRRNSPRPLGSPNDLVGFHDLFYKPGGGSLRQRVRQESSSELSSPDSQSSQTRLSNIPFDLKSPNQRRASGLSMLARKLSKEYEQLSSKERTGSQSGDNVTMGSPRPSLIRKPTEGSLEFIFEGTHPTELSTDGQFITEQRLGLSSCRHQDNIPEDVASVFSAGTGKEVEASEDETEHVHVRSVEALTPAEVATDHRLSYTGQMEEVNVPRPISQDNPSQSVVFEGLYRPSISDPLSQGRIASGLQPPLTDNTRSSFYTTASSMSNMSNLSDFPAPPRNHMSLLSAFFNEANGRSSADVGDAEISYPIQSNDHNRLTFGAGADVEDIVQALSNNPRPF